MNVKITMVVVFVAFLGVMGCDNKDNSYFNGEIRYFDVKSAITRNVESKQVTLNGAYTGMIAVYDSLFFCWSPIFSDHFFKIFNVDTGDEIGNFVGKGRGPQEAVSVNCIMQFFKKGDDLMTLLYASNEGRLFIWNISRSVREGTTVYDAILPYDNYRIRFPFYQSDNTMFAYVPAEPGGNEVTPPFYQKRTISTNELLSEYPVYTTKPIHNSGAEILLYSWDVMKPDGSKIVQAMSHLPQLNVIDTRTGDVVGYRMKNGPDFSILETDKSQRFRYYNYVDADDNYIYAVWWGKEQWDDRFGGQIPDFNTIQVFDWSGKLCYELVTDRSFFRVWLDPVRKRLYTINMNNDEIYYLDGFITDTSQ